MEEVQKDTKNIIMDYKFYIGKGLDNIMFYYKEKDVLKVLGNPTEVETQYDNYKDGTTGKVVIYYYNNRNLSISFNYYGGEQESIRIYTDKIIFKGYDLYKKNKEEIINLICNISNISKNKAYEKFLFGECQYNFDDIGLTLWFKGKKLIDVCINKPIGSRYTKAKKRAEIVPGRTQIDKTIILESKKI
mgnify:CR=1 FL=1